MVGVEVRRRDHIERVRARWVIGADGWRSAVARLAGAEEYLARVGERAGGFTYWPRTAAWNEDPDFGGVGVRFVHEGDTLRFGFEIDERTVLIGTTPPRARALTWISDRARCVRDDLDGSRLGAWIAGVEPLEPLRFISYLRYFVRRSAGPGWALVGDAGMHKDPGAALGITDALRSSRRLASALACDSDLAVERYWRHRDVEQLPFFVHSLELGALGYAGPLGTLVTQRMAASRALADRVAEVVDTTRLPSTTLRPIDLLAIVTRAVLTGRLGALRELGRAIGRVRAFEAEMRARRHLLDEIEERCAAHGVDERSGIDRSGAARRGG